MLPSADAASIAFSEVTSFINYWIAQNGRGAFRLLLADLKGLEDRDPNSALRSVSGLGLKEWIGRWQEYLRALGTAPKEPESGKPAAAGPDMRAIRLGDLLLRGQHFTAAARVFGEALAGAPQVSALRFRASEAELAAHHDQAARERLGELSTLDGAHAGWFALKGRFEAEAGRTQAAQEASRMASSLDPWSELVACEGHQRGLLGSDPWQLPDPSDPIRQKLCFMARARPPVQ
jgi:hypothetical protein